MFRLFWEAAPRICGRVSADSMVAHCGMAMLFGLAHDRDQRSRLQPFLRGARRSRGHKQPVLLPYFDLSAAQIGTASALQCFNASRANPSAYRPIQTAWVCDWLALNCNEPTMSILSPKRSRLARSRFRQAASRFCFWEIAKRSVGIQK